MRCKRRFLLFLILLMLLAGCASIPARRWPPTRRGVYHKVKKGDTLWGISQAYGVSLGELVDANRIPDAEMIVVGQLIFIPDKDEVVSLGSLDKAGSFIWPIRREAISSCEREEGEMANEGILILAEEGEKVLASRPGEAVFCDESFEGYGKTVILDHKDGYLTVYAYNKEILVKPGNNVAQGEAIARVGSSGRAKTSRLHFEIRKGQVSANPFYYLPER